MENTLPVFKTRNQHTQKFYLDGINDLITTEKFPYAEISLPWAGDIEYGHANLTGDGEEFVGTLSDNGTIDELSIITTADGAFIEILKSTSASWSQVYKDLNNALQKVGGVSGKFKFVPATNVQAVMAGTGTR